MSSLTAQQIGDNAASRGHWDCYADHRARVTALLRPDPAARPGRLCVLGAGNCNDLDLAALAALYREVHLVDLDPDALAFGVQRQGVAGRSGVFCHGNIDVTAMLAAVENWTPATPLRNEDLGAYVEEPRRRVA